MNIKLIAIGKTDSAALQQLISTYEKRLVRYINFELQLLRSVLKETVQRATADGEVETIYPKVGELVGLGSPIMSISMVNDIWGTFNVREDQLKDMKVGTKFKVFVPALDKQIEMQVTSLKDQGSYAVWKATKSSGQYDLKTFQVKARPVQKVDGLKPGMSLIIK